VSLATVPPATPSSDSRQIRSPNTRPARSHYSTRPAAWPLWRSGSGACWMAAILAPRSDPCQRFFGLRRRSVQPSPAGVGAQL